MLMSLHKQITMQLNSMKMKINYNKHHRRSGVHKVKINKRVRIEVPITCECPIHHHCCCAVLMIEIIKMVEFGKCVRMDR